MPETMTELASIVSTQQGDLLMLKGQWLIRDIYYLERSIQALLNRAKNLLVVDATQIESMDTAGAFLFNSLQKELQKTAPAVKTIGLPSKFDVLLNLVSTEMRAMPDTLPAPPQFNWLYRVGKLSIDLYEKGSDYLTFLGELIVHIFVGLLRPFKVQWRSMINEIDQTGYRALPIIGVMMFLIGIVLAYQMSVELRVYGANVYVVDVAGIAILREFSPLITSVIIAGRTSTAYAALLGTMKVNEEIDALKTMGLSPMDRLVLPKILGLLIALPLLVVWGNVFGVLGSMVMAKGILGISYLSFLQRFREVVAIKHFYLGLVKTPIFAMIIAGIGCFQGFQAEGSAESVGKRTTKAAVQSIFLIIFADGMFSILFEWLDL